MSAMFQSEMLSSFILGYGISAMTFLYDMLLGYSNELNVIVNDIKSDICAIVCSGISLKCNNKIELWST